MNAQLEITRTDRYRESPIRERLSKTEIDSGRIPYFRDQDRSVPRSNYQTESSIDNSMTGDVTEITAAGTENR